MTQGIFALQAFIDRERTQEIAGRNFLESLQHFSYEHDIILKTVLVVAAVLGVVAIRYASGFSNLAVRVISWICGGAVTLIAVVSFFVLQVLAPGPFSLSDHQFTPSIYNGAKLYYQGHIPILEVQYGKRGHYGAGYDQGYLLGSSIDTIIGRLRTLEWLLGAPEASQLPGLLAEISKKLPERYRDELRGVADGFNAWADTQWMKPKKISYDEILLFHLMPDRIIHNADQLNQQYAGIQGQSALALQEKHPAQNGCTAVMARDAVDGVMMMHTLDWPSAGVLGNYTLIRNCKYSDDTQDSVEIGMPGLIGTLTGMNASGFTAAMNICASLPESVDGMPAVFANRALLEKVTTVKQAKRELAVTPTLGPYHLSVADKKKASSLHFYQGDHRKTVVRNLEEDTPLIVTNASYQDEYQYDHMFYSRERDAIVKRLFREHRALGAQKLLETSATLPYVNNQLTLQVAHMTPKTRRIALAWQNAFSGAVEPIELDTTGFFVR